MEENNQQPKNIDTNNQHHEPKDPQPQTGAHSTSSHSNGASSGFRTNKNLLLSGVIIVVVLLLLVAVPKIQNRSKNDTDQTDRSDVATTAVAPQSADAHTKALTRTQAKEKFANKTIEISGDCSIVPHTLTQPKGTTILLDNNTATAHTLVVGKKTYRISPYHYTLSWLNVDSATLPVICDGKDEGATVLVQ